MDLPAGIQQRLRQRGLRLSPGMRAAIDVLRADPSRVWRHATLLAALSAQGVRLDRVTLYRLLQRLEQAGLVRNVTPAAEGKRRSGAFVWVGAVEPSLTISRSCPRCGRSDPTPLPSPALERALQQLAQTLAAMDAATTRAHLTLHTPCARCQRD